MVTINGAIIKPLYNADYVVSSWEVEDLRQESQEQLSYEIKEVSLWETAALVFLQVAVVELLVWNSVFLSLAGRQSQVAGGAADRTVQLEGHPQGSMDAVERNEIIISKIQKCWAGLHNTTWGVRSWSAWWN